MNELEDLLSRTLRDPARALPVPADPLPGIRARARAQRRGTALSVAAIVLIAAAAVLVPAVLGRLTRPAPVATDPAPGLLPWAGRGALLGDRELVEAAVRLWPGGSRPAHLLWAERLGGDQGELVVLLQGFDRAGRPMLAEVGGTDRRELVLVASGPLPDPGVAAVRLVEPSDPSRSATVLLVAPGGATVVLPPPAAWRGGPAGGRAREVPPEPSGLLAVPDELGGHPVTVLDPDGTVVGSGEVPPRGTLAVARGQVRLVAPRWPVAGAPPTPRPWHWTEGRLLANRLNGEFGDGTPTEVAVLDDGTAVTVPGGSARLGFYEVHRGARDYLASAVWLAGRPYCVRLEPVPAGSGPPAVLVARCWLPGPRRGILSVQAVAGNRVTGLAVAAAGPGQREVRPTLRGARGGYTAALGPEFPRGAGEVRLVDAAGRARPPVRLGPYEP